METAPSLSFATSAGALLAAADIAGGLYVLARRLRVPAKQLRGWMEGEEETPRSVFLRAVEFVRLAHAGSAVRFKAP
jgi:hypothetical protein